MAVTDVTTVTPKLVELVTCAVPSGVPVLEGAHWVSDYVGQFTDSQDRFAVWWLSGPSMQGSRLVQAIGGQIRREWVWRVHGAVQIAAGGGEFDELRATGVAISDALDADPTLGQTVHDSTPSAWSVQPEHRVLVGGVWAAYMEIRKTVVTVSTP